MDAETLYRERTDYLADWVWDIDTGGRYTFSSSVVESVLGYSASELIGKKCLELIAPEDQAKCCSALSEATRAVQPIYNMLCRFATRSGEVRTLESSLMPLIQDGRLEGFRGVSHHLPEDLQSYREACEALMNYRAALETSAAGILILQGDRVVYANPKLTEITGYSRTELVASDPMFAIHEDDRQMVEDYYRRRLTGGATPQSYQMRVRHKSGDIRVLDVAATVVIYNGAPAFLYTLIDMTDRYRAEAALSEAHEALTELTSNLNAVVYRLDPDLTMKTLIGAEATLTGRTHREHIGSDIWLRGAHPDDQERVKEEIQRIVESGEPGLIQYRQVNAKSGAVSWVQSTVNPEYDEQDKLKCINGVTVDITNLKNAEREKLEAERRYEEQTRSFYRETIFSVTQGKLLISDPPDVTRYLARSRCCADVDNAEEASRARSAVESFCVGAGLEGDELQEFMLAVGEAITNAVKHAGAGQVRAGLDDKNLWAAVQDEGGGIDSLILPRAALLKGFSTKPSLGLGYSIMLDVCDQVALCTGHTGTVVVLIKNLEPQEEPPAYAAIPDTW